MDHFQQENNKEQNIRSEPLELAKIAEKLKGNRRKHLLFFSAALIAFIIVVVLIVNDRAGRTDPLCGKWDLDGTTVYVFDGKGSGALELPKANYEFRYKISGNTVSIDFADDRVRDISYEFTVDADKLTIERKEKNDTVIHELKKQPDVV